MKRILAFLLALATVLALCACSSGVSNPSPGGNTPNTPATNPAPTQPAETVPTEPPKSAAVLEVEAAISALGNITTSSLAALNAAQTAYDALPSSEKKNVENYADLVAAWTSYNTQLNQAAAAEIDAVIANMGDTTYKNRQTVIDAMKLYNAASKEVQACVTKAETLKTAAATVAKAMMDKMEKEEDFVRNLAFYYHTEWERGDDYWYADQRCFALPYLGKQGSDVWLRFVCNYTASDWVFFKKITFACDDQRFYKTFSYYDVVRDNGGRKVWEYIDMNVNATEIAILEAIASSEKTIIRFEGDDYYKDFTVKQTDKEAIRFTLDLYYLLGGK